MSRLTAHYARTCEITSGYSPPLYLVIARCNRFETFVNRLSKGISVDFLHFSWLASLDSTPKFAADSQEMSCLPVAISYNATSILTSPFSFSHRRDRKLLVSINQNNDRLHGRAGAFDVILEKILYFLPMLGCNGR